MTRKPRRAHAGNPELTVLGFPGPAELRRRLPRLMIGILALGVGIAMMVEARLGVSPYDVLHQGLADLLGLHFGVGTLLFAFGIGPLGHYFLLHLHLGVAGGDPDPDATIGE